MFGYDGEPGGGPAGLWYRLTGSPDRGDTARRFGAALEIVANEGHTILVLDEVKDICKQLRLTEAVESILNLGRSAGICAILSTTETSYKLDSTGDIIWASMDLRERRLRRAGQHHVARTSVRRIDIRPGQRPDMTLQDHASSA
jgi:hypothetical protein